MSVGIYLPNQHNAAFFWGETLLTPRNLPHVTFTDGATWENSSRDIHFMSIYNSIYITISTT